MEHVHASAVDALIVIGVYVLLKIMLFLLRARLDEESATLQAINALQL